MNMNRNRMAVGIGFFLVIVAGAVSFMLYQNFISTTAEKRGSTVSGEGLVMYRDTGFSPSVLRVKQGTRTTFVNASQNAVWPASDPHPTHTLYSGSSIEKCGTAEEQALFDSCREIAPGSVWSFTFNKIGVWSYHNHLRFGHRGTIQVAE